MVKYENQQKDKMNAPLPVLATNIRTFCARQKTLVLVSKPRGSKLELLHMKTRPGIGRRKSDGNDYSPLILNDLFSRLHQG